jgi:hypothetical protein
MSACSLIPRSKSSSKPQLTATPTVSEPSQNNITSQPTLEPSKVSEPTPTVQPTIEKITSSILQQNMEAVNSYRRKTKTVTTCEGKQSEKKEEYAYVKNPFSSYIMLDFVTSGSYNEEIIVSDTMWSRMKKDIKWDKALPGQWFADPPRTFKFSLSTQMYPINYEKLTLTPSGNEQVNGVNCIKYNVSGSYQDEFSFKTSPQKFPITLSASGDIWIAADPAVNQVIISQRITVKTDIVNTEIKDKQGSPLHIAMEDEIEDDILDINSTTIQAPPDSETKTPGEGN